MTDKILGQLSGEEILELILNSGNEFYGDSDSNEGDNIVSLEEENVALNIELESEPLYHDNSEVPGILIEQAQNIGLEEEEPTALGDISLQSSIAPECDEDDEIRDPTFSPDDCIDTSTASEGDEHMNNEQRWNGSQQHDQDKVEGNATMTDSRQDNGTEQTEEPPTSKGRKRKRNPAAWARNIRKQKSDKGEAHVNSSGRFVPAKKIGEPCKCRKRCFDNLSNDCRNRVFKEFYDIGDKNKQDAYLFNMIDRHPVKRRRASTGERSETRKYSYKYFVRENDGSKVEVCLTTFQSVHGIGLKRVKRVKQRPTVAPEDKRGTHTNRANSIPSELKDKVKNHISSFPRRQSHYSRTENPNKYYLHENLNVRRMWLLYLSKHEPEQLAKLRAREKMSPEVKMWLYREIFLTEFNMSFGMPRSDTCLRCDQLEASLQEAEKTSNIDKKSKVLNEREIHQRKAQAAYDKLKMFSEMAKQDTDIDGYTFDFQQNLPVPCLTTSDLFYMRQLWTYNFGVHDLKTGDGIMHIWDESTAARGSSEVCSCLEKTILGRHSEATHLVLFSDGCCGQNKNKAMITFLAAMCANENVPYTRIDHFFLIRGHTFLPNDRDFALIEKRKKTESPKVPCDYVEIIEASRTVQPFIVEQISGNDIKDYKSMADKAVKPNLTSTHNEKLQVRAVMWFSYGASEEIDPANGTKTLVEHNDEVWCKYTHNTMESWKKVPLFKRNIKANSLRACPKYSGPIPIKAAKYKDLNDLVKKGLLAEEYAGFYSSLPHDNMPKKSIQEQDESEYDDDYTQ